MTEPILSVRSLRTSFLTGDGPKQILNGISFHINKGETLAVVGESGSGKSVTALSIMGLHPAKTVRQSGAIDFDGRNLLAATQADMRQIRGNDIAMIFQEPMTSLNPVLTVGRQLIEPLVLHRQMTVESARQEAKRLLDKVRIPAASSRLDDYPHNFSGGMRQRVMIAMALACQPKILIADEPTTALDVTIQAQIIDLLKDLQRAEGMAVMFITHDMGVVAEVADRALVMYKGEAIECDTTEKIFATPKETYTRALLAAVPRLGSMTGRSVPAQFATVDRRTGLADTQVEEDHAAPQDATLLEVSKLVTRFSINKGFLGRLSGRVHAVENVSFSVRSGETLSLVGESGCGKSTTGRSIVQLTSAESGSIRLDGSELGGLDPKALRKKRQDIQIIFQDPFASLNPRMQVGDAIAEPLLVNKLASPAEARTKVVDLLGEVGLEESMMGRYPHEFSGGQRQRICIARALAVEPKIIIADEAVSALDVSVKAQVVNLMMKLQESRGISYVFISHDMAVVERISHRVAVMYLGEIVEIGSRQAIFENPQHPYTKRLLSAVPIPDPVRRNERHRLSEREISNPIRSLRFAPQNRTYITVADDHQVMEWGEEWQAAS
ncbi:MAG: ABC transporter ATP-binding protein [Pseudomonadota bacterium]